MIRPERTELTAAFWAAAGRGAVLLQRCLECGRIWHPPAPTCPADPGHRIEWFTASGHGRLHSYTTVEHAAHPAVLDAVPYVVALVELAEGPLVICNLVDADGVEISPDLPVTLSTGVAVGGQRLPVARPAGPRGATGTARRA